MLWRRSQTFKVKTLNDYLCDVSSFCGWLVTMDRIQSNPLARIGRMASKSEEEEERRAFTSEEFKRLCAVSESRAFIYKLTLFTGLRRNEVCFGEMSGKTRMAKPS